MQDYLFYDKDIECYFLVRAHHVLTAIQIAYRHFKHPLFVVDDSVISDTSNLRVISEEEDS